MAEIKKEKFNVGKSVSASEMEGLIQKMSQALRKTCPSDESLVFVGIARGGVPLAKRLFKHLNGSGKADGPLMGELDITFYRDDISLREDHPVIKHTDIPFSLDHKTVVLVDDVLFSGRTIRAAMDALVDFGRPDQVRLAVLVDRGHRELPIHADFVGLEVDTEKSDQVEVHWQEWGDGEDSIRILKTKDLNA
jgi:pyrimidine operon attenuation protein/uracil phosphoribosyltransferase